MLRCGAPWVLCYDIIADPVNQNLADSNIQALIEEMLASAAVRICGASPPCSSFSEAVTPPVRDRLHPTGKPDITAAMSEKVKDGNRHARWTAKVAWICFQQGVYFWCENPWRSWWWRQPSWRNLVRFVRRRCPTEPFYCADFCRWRTPWRKRTLFFMFDGALAGEKDLCRRDHTHVILRGHDRRIHLTKLAEPYPWGLALKLARNCIHAVRTLGRAFKSDQAGDDLAH